MSEKIKSIFASLRKRITLKRVLFTALGVFAVLLPTVIAIICVVGSDSSAETPTKRINTVILYDDGGKELYREDFNARESGNTSLVSIFNAINNGLIQSEKISESVATEPPLTAKLIGTAEEKTLICHFSFTQGASYCIDGNGTYFKISSEDSERFLSSEFAETLYKDAVAPSLSTADGDTVVPLSVEWHYKNIDGIFLSASKNAVTDEKINYHVTGGISLSFTAEPDVCHVEITDDGESVFSGNLSELPAFKLNSSSQITVTVTAEWRQAEGRRFYGTSSYTFDITVHNRAEFSLSKTELSAGEYAVFKATYISDLSKLYLSCEGFELTPTVMQSGETAYAIIPCPASLGSDCDFKVTAAYGVAAQTFTLSVTEAEAQKQYALNLAAQGDGLTPTVTASAAEQIFGAGGTVSPIRYGYLQGGSFGTEEDGGSLLYYTRYTRDDGHGMTVCSLSAGKVVLVGESSVLGKYAVIDVGLGVRLFYTNLSEIDVSVGEYVTFGDCLGKSDIVSEDTGDGFAIAVICNGYVLNFETLINL